MRLPPIAPNDLTDVQRTFFRRMRKGVSAKYDSFTTTRSDGALLGPWNAWLHDPEIGGAIWTLTQAMTKARRIPDAARQVAILTVGARFGAAYESYAHGAVARSKHGMSERRLATLAAGARPDDLDDQEAIAFDVAIALSNGDVLPSVLYDRAVSLFGQEGANELFYLVGYYCLVSITLNAFDIGIPEAVPPLP